MTKKLLALLLALMMLLPAASAMAGTITVTGSGVITADPDEVSIGVTMTSRGTTLQQAQSQVAEQVSAVTAAVKALGLADEDIITSYYSVYPLWDDVDGVSQVTGYSASHAMRITCRSVELLDPVVNAMTEAGATQIDDISFASSKSGDLYLSALALAVQDARTKADALASASGFSELELVSITENGSSGSYRAVLKSAYEAEAAMDSSFDTGVHSGSVSVSAAITVVFETK